MVHNMAKTLHLVPEMCGQLLMKYAVE